MRQLKWLSLLGLLLLPASSLAQSVRYQSQAISSRGAGIANATIAVCTQPANTNTQPCSPLATLATSTSTTSGGANPLTADSFGNFFFYAAPGRYTVQIFGPAVFGQLVVPDTVVPIDTAGPITLGNGNSFTPVTFSNHNSMFWAGPGASPTFDQAVAACPTSCQVEISPTYTGADTANLFTTSSGYKIANNGNSTVSFDRRGNFGTPGNPTATPLYNIIFNGRCAGQLVKQCINMPITGTIADSSIASTSLGWVFNATLPTNNGMLAGGGEDLLIGNTITVGGSSAPIISNDSEVYWAPAVVDSGIPQIAAYSAQAHNRGVGNVNVSTGYIAQPPDVTSTGRETFHYGFDAFGQNGTGVQTGYGYHNYGSWLSEVNGAFDEVDAGFTITNITEATNTVTVTTSATCNFVTGESVRIQGVGGSFTTTTQFPYNGVYTVLTPGCNGGSTFTYTDPTSGLSTVAGGTATAQALHHLIQIRSSDNSVLFNPSLDGVGWKFITNDTNLRVQISNFGLQAVGTIGAVSSGGTFLGGVGTEFAGIYQKEGGAITGSAGDTVCGGVTATHTLNCSYNNDGASGAGFPMTRTIGTGNVTTAGTAIATLTCQAQTGITVTGAATTDNVIANIGATLPATWQTGIAMQAHVTATNTVTVYLCNPTATANITPAATQVNVRVVR